MNRINGVFSGGGVKSIAFSGCISQLEEQGYTFDKVVGTSGGSLATMLIALDYKPKEIEDILFNLDYEKMKDCRNHIPIIGKYINLLKNKGLYKGDYILNWCYDLCKKKNKMKFKDVLDENGESRLKVIVTDCSLKRMVCFPDDVKELYGIDGNEIDIAFAIRCSISIPLFFEPQILKYKNNINQEMISCLVDGGVTNNFGIFLNLHEKDTPTLGFNLDGQLYNTINSKTNIIDYISDLIDTVVDKNEDVYLFDKDSVRTIDVKTSGVNSTDFGITKRQVMNLYNAGYHATQQYLESDDFKNYISKYNK